MPGKYHLIGWFLPTDDCFGKIVRVVDLSMQLNMSIKSHLAPSNFCLENYFLGFLSRTKLYKENPQITSCLFLHLENKNKVMIFSKFN